MGQEFSQYALGGVLLLAFGCSGQDIRFSTATAGAPNGGGSVGQQPTNSDLGGGGSAGGGSKGGSYFGGNGNDEAIGGSAGDDAILDNAAGAAGSPDPGPGPGPEHGGWLAYDIDLSDAFGVRQIQLVRADGACGRQLVPVAGHAKQPAFSANGKKLAYAYDGTGTFQIYVMDLESGDRTQLTNEAEGATYPSWSPSGNSIAFVTGDTEDQFHDGVNSNDSSSTVKLVDTQTLMTTTLTEVGHPAYTSSAFAGESLLLAGNAVSIVGIHTDTLAHYDLITGGITDASSPAISPDGSRYAYSYTCGAAKQLFLARVDGTTGETCSKATPLATNSDGLITASWGPAGYIAAETLHHDIVLVPSDGSPGIQVVVNTAQPERNPAFAPASVNFDCDE